MASPTRPRRYFALHFIIFRILGLGWWHHPDEEDTRNFQGRYLYYSIVTQLLWVVGFITLESIDPFIGETDIDRFMFSLSFVITHDLTLIKIYIFYFRNKEIQDVVHTLEIKLYNYYQNNAKNRVAVRIANLMTSSFVFFGWATIINTDIYGAIQDFHWKVEVLKLNDTTVLVPRALPMPIYIPWKYETDTLFVLACLLETIGLLWTGHIVLVIDTFIGSVIIHMSTQFKILCEAINTAYDRTMLTLYRETCKETEVERNELYKLHCQNDIEEFVKASYPAEEIESALNNTFKSCIRQHQLLIVCVEKFKTTYSYGFMTQLLSSMAAICVVMVQVSQDASSFKSMRLVTSLAFFAAMIIQLALQCFTGNELTLQASAVGDAVMHSKWEKMSPRLRRLLLVMMLRSQRPLRLSAAGFAYMNIDCFLSIMKAAYSYYAVLSQKNV